MMRPEAGVAAAAAIGALFWMAGCTAQSGRAAGRGTSPAAGAEARAVASVKELMLGILDPAADRLWGAVTVIESAEGVEERVPRTDEDWARVRSDALAVAESGNLLMLPGRTRDREAWLAFSRALVDTGERAAQAAARKDAAALLEAGEQVYAACTQCHFVYWQPPPPEPPAPLLPPIRR